MGAKYFKTDDVFYKNMPAAEGKSVEIFLGKTETRITASFGEFAVLTAATPCTESEYNEAFNKALEILKGVENYTPPDNGDMCWTVGAQEFTRKEVADLLHTQRAMISNDMKRIAGTELSADVFSLLENPRKPKF